MIKDKEWLKEELQKEIEKPIYFHSAVTSERQIVYREMLRLVSQLEEPEKVVIPQFVADWIEEMKKSGDSLRVAISALYADEKVCDWLALKDKDGRYANQNDFALAWINGYEVEKEKLYYLEFPNNHFKGVCLTIDYNGAKCLHGKAYSKAMGYKNTFTESELLGIDETGFIRDEVTE